MARDRYDNNDDDSDVTTAVRPRRVEVLTGPERRRKWPDEVKIAIVAEALVKGVVVSEVAGVTTLLLRNCLGGCGGSGLRP